MHRRTQKTGQSWQPQNPAASVIEDDDVSDFTDDDRETVAEKLGLELRSLEMTLPNTDVKEANGGRKGLSYVSTTGGRSNSLIVSSHKRGRFEEALGLKPQADDPTTSANTQTQILTGHSSRHKRAFDELVGSTGGSCMRGKTIFSNSYSKPTKVEPLPRLDPPKLNSCNHSLSYLIAQIKLA
ncbi:unnamed protein product [Protopolystoma xenopodis]|uniref:Uncharacterized protein n=1 Tax=Protopolystoma xenopodis TaxID=117903 RepID=A0A448WXY9_9PLAT|nr:unnamed protein product [Protopolystoma xenopodis]